MELQDITAFMEYQSSKKPYGSCDFQTMFNKTLSPSQKETLAENPMYTIGKRESALAEASEWE